MLGTLCPWLCEEPRPPSAGGAAVLVVDAPGGNKKGLGEGQSSEAKGGGRRAARGGDRSVRSGVAGIGERVGRASKPGNPGFFGLTQL